MIVKWFKYGSGDGKAAFNYLLNHRVDDGTSRILRGNANITLSIIQSLDFKKKYKSGCLSFEESNATEENKQEIMDLFEKAAFAGIPAQNRNICWIEHTDKNRLELNFVIPRVELETGKSYQPYFDRVDRKRFEVFRDYINQKYGFSNPNDPSKSQSLKVGDLAKYSKTETLEYLDKYITKQIEDGEITNQEQVVAELKNVGYLIKRVGANYITIQSGSSKPIRLKGKYYCKDWNSSNQVENSSLKKLKQTLQNEIEKSAIYNRKLYYDIEPVTATKPTQKQERRKTNDIK